MLNDGYDIMGMEVEEREEMEFKLVYVCGGVSLDESRK